MKAEELMIGDLVRVSKDVSIKKGTIVEIRAIDADREFHELKGCATCVPVDNPDGLSGGVWLDYLEPIPLTSEIIAKNFEKKALYGIFDDFFNFTIREYNDGMYILNYHCCEFDMPDTQVVGICYVHELQHFFTAHGIEKEIEVNSVVRTTENTNINN